MRRGDSAADLRYTGPVVRDSTGVRKAPPAAAKGAGVVAVVLVGFVTCGSGTTGESAVTAVVVVLLFGAVGVDARVWKVMSV